jgi:rare lipoprotein A
MALVAIVGPLLAACATHPGTHGRKAFTSREFGVAVSKRVTNNPNPPHGGGTRLVGAPYKVRGLVYKPKADPVGYDVKGQASWYGWDFHGRLTANGEIFSANAITGGSPDLPLPSYARVTNLDNGRSLLVRFNDRGPYMAGRVVDLSERAATLLGYANDGTARVRVQYVGPAPLNGDDTRYLMASLNQTEMPRFGLGQGTQLASVEPADIRPMAAPRPHLGIASAPHPASRSSGSPELRQVLAAVSTLSYAEAQAEDTNINNAHAAVDAMAARVPDLREWVEATDDDQRAIKLVLGVYENAAVARATAMQFAMLGAVDENAVTADDGAPATQLVVTHLKPGVARSDVLDLVHKLGLKDVVLY